MSCLSAPDQYVAANRELFSVLSSYQYSTCASKHPSQSGLSIPSTMPKMPHLSKTSTVRSSLISWLMHWLSKVISILLRCSSTYLATLLGPQSQIRDCHALSQPQWNHADDDGRFGTKLEEEEVENDTLVHGRRKWKVAFMLSLGEF